MSFHFQEHQTLLSFKVNRFFDLSHTLSSKTPVFPGDEQPEFRVNEKLKKSNIQVMTIKLNTHLGTHLDCPSHLGDKNIFTDNMSIDHFYGHATVIDVRDKICNEEINIELKAKYFNYDYIIFFTGHDLFWGKDKYFNTYPALSKKLTKELAKSSIKGIGIDTCNVDKVNDLNFTNHHILLNQEKVIIENLTNLDKLIDKNFKLMVFPLKIKNGDGSPIRAVALID